MKEFVFESFLMRRQFGFTLVELLASLALLAIITSFLVTAIGHGRKALQISEQVRLQSTTRTVQDYLEQIISLAVPEYAIEPPRRHVFTFRGTPHRLSFVANTKGFTTRAGLHKFDVFLSVNASSTNSSSTNLMVSQSLFRPLAAKTEGREDAKPVRLLAGVSSVRFRYYGSVKKGDPARWHTSWRQKSSLPHLTEILVEFPAGDVRSWPLVVVAHPVQ